MYNNQSLYRLWLFACYRDQEETMAQDTTIKCPTCGQSEIVLIASAVGQMKIDFAGGQQQIKSISGAINWDDDASAQCAGCGWAGTAAEMSTFNVAGSIGCALKYIQNLPDVSDQDALQRIAVIKSLIKAKTVIESKG